MGRRKEQQMKRLWHELHLLSPYERQAWMDNPHRTAAWLEYQSMLGKRLDYTVPLTDRKTASLLVQNAGYTRLEARELVAKWRRAAAEHFYLGPVGWFVKSGFDLRKHLPLWNYFDEDQTEQLRAWQFRNDAPTEQVLALWFPSFVLIRGVDIDDMQGELEKFRKEFDLPIGSFGSAALHAALLIGHTRFSQARLDDHDYHQVTDTLFLDARRLTLSAHRGSRSPRDYGGRLRCYAWDEDARSDMNFSLLQVVKVKGDGLK